MPPASSCPRCRQLVPYQTPQCLHCGFAFVSSDPSRDPATRMLLPVGRTALAIIAGYLGLLSIFLVPAPLALATGIWALVDLKHKPEKTGHGRAVFAIVMGTACSIILGLLLYAAHKSPPR